ncbi:MAG: DUF4340 domain-containing protein [Aggregatilineales bacterium]
MRNRGLLVLFGVFLLLAALLVLQDRGTIGGGNNTAIPTAFLLRVFPEMAVLDIQAIRLQNPASGQTLSLARDDFGNWESFEYSEALDQNLATTIARSVVLLPYTRTINLSEDTDIAQYGFDSPQFLLSVQMVNGESHVVLVGDPLQTGPEFYALVDDREQLYVIQRSPIDYLVTFFADPPIIPDGASIAP